MPMLNYRLIINDIEIELDDKIVIQLNKYAYELGEFASKISYSNNIDIYLTPSNLKAFEFVNNINAFSKISKTKLTASLYINEVQIFNNGVAFVNSVSKDKINLMLTSEQITFYNLLDKSIQFTDYNDLNLDWTVQNIYDNNNNTEELSFLLNETNSNTTNDTIHRTDNKAIADLTHPSIRVDSLMKRIINQAGYTEDFTLWDDIVKNSYILCSNTEVKNTDNYIGIWNRPQITNYQFLSNAVGALDRLILFQNIAQGPNNFDNFGGQILFYRVKYAGTYRVRVKGKITNPSGRANAIYLNTNSGAVQICSSYDLIWDFDYYYDLVLDNSFNWFISIFLRHSCIATNDNVSIQDFECEITPQTPLKILFGGEFKINAGLPDIKQTDYFKAICQLSFMVPKIDEISKIVQLIPIKDIISNISNVQDLSNNFIELKSMEFKYGKWAQLNNFTYESDILSEGVNGIGKITIANDLLGKETEFIKSIFSASAEVVRTGENIAVAYCPMYDSGIYKNKLKPRILYPKQLLDGKGIILTDKSYSSYGLTINDPYFGTFEDLSFDILLTNNIDAFSYVFDMRFCKIEILVSEIEYYELNLYNLIYINQLQSYFYINKISGYTAGKSCILDAIKIL